MAAAARLSAIEHRAARQQFGIDEVFPLGGGVELTLEIGHTAVVAEVGVQCLRHTRHRCAGTTVRAISIVHADRCATAGQQGCHRLGTGIGRFLLARVGGLHVGPIEGNGRLSRHLHVASVTLIGRNLLCGAFGESLLLIVVVEHLRHGRGHTARHAFGTVQEQRAIEIVGIVLVPRGLNEWGDGRLDGSAGPAAVSSSHRGRFGTPFLQPLHLVGIAL